MNTTEKNKFLNTRNIEINKGGNPKTFPTLFSELCCFISSQLDTDKHLCIMLYLLYRLAATLPLQK